MDTLFDLGHLTTEEIEAGMTEVLASPKAEGTLMMIVRRPKVNAREVVETGTLDIEKGLIGDNWLTKGNRWRRGGDPKRQITVMNWRFARLVAGSDDRVPLAGDQLFVDLDLSGENIPTGTHIAVGNAIIEVTKPPHLGCKKFVERFGMDAMTFANSEFGKLRNLRGVNAMVIRSGEIAVGDSIRIVEVASIQDPKMNAKPKCIIVTGRQGSGKTTLAKKLGERLWVPVICRDEIKEGYVSTYGVRHDELPPDTNGRVTDHFFRLVNEYLAGNVSVVIEAAFQHGVWEFRLPAILELASVRMVLCSADEATAANRAIQRGLDDPEREFYHGDNRVVHFKKTGEILTPAPYEEPNLDVPTIRVWTQNGYSPSIDEIAEKILSIGA